jgi:hypothetical protein
MASRHHERRLSRYVIAGGAKDRGGAARYCGGMGETAYWRVVSVVSGSPGAHAGVCVNQRCARSRSAQGRAGTSRLADTRFPRALYCSCAAIARRWESSLRISFHSPTGHSQRQSRHFVTVPLDTVILPPRLPLPCCTCMRSYHIDKSTRRSLSTLPRPTASLRSANNRQNEHQQEIRPPEAMDQREDGRRARTGLSDEFKALELEMNLRHEGTHTLDALHCTGC